MQKFYKCPHCGNIIAMVKDSGVNPVCCAEPMIELKAASTDGAFEKHVPAVSCEGSRVTVKVGEAAHPMIEAHYIEWIALETNQGICIKHLTPDDDPESDFALSEFEKPVCAYAYCNLHGLWSKDVI